MAKHKWILVAEDDANDADLTLRVLSEAQPPIEVVHVSDGAQALNCLYQRDEFISRDTGPPVLVLLDLKMPRVDGFDVLERIKNDVALRSVPVAIFSSSREQSDLERSYQLGANAYVVKPVKFQQFVDALQQTKRFWVGVNELPTAYEAPGAIATIAPQAQLALGDDRPSQ